ncbi:MAG: HDOD domain-containing protein [Acidobacteria bacterium]|nr:HDOD domain-containing protein [Acidobacteriota bacterium]
MRAAPLLMDEAPFTKIEFPPSLGKLPPFPAVALQALKALSNDAATAPQIERLISTDAVFASSTLHCANSALFALPKRVLTLRHAIVVLGRDRLRCIVLTSALRSFASAPLASKQFKDWWRHSLATAVLSEALAKASRSNCSGAYIAGLLHDVGRLGLIVRLTREQWRSFVGMAEAPRRAGMSIVEMEQEIFGLDHCELGARMTAEWGLPEELTFAARYHHDPEAAASDEAALFAAASCEITSQLGFAALKYPRLRTIADLTALMPEPAAPLIESDPEKLRDALETKLQSLNGMGAA